MDNNELKFKISTLTKKEISITNLCKKLNLNKYEILHLISELRDEGIIISRKIHDDDIYLYNQGEKDIEMDNIVRFKTDDNHEFKFVAISDTRFGSKSQQLTILNDIYQKAHDLGYSTVIHCGNMTDGIYSPRSNYSDSTFLDDSQIQIDYIVKNYPKIKGVNTYFITGTKDEKHLMKNGINIGKRISSRRNDLIYLGPNSSDILIDNTVMKIFNPALTKTYTTSYRPQQQIDSFRSEDKPDILLYGGLLDMQQITHRDVHCLTIPSVCATTKEMDERRFSNTIGAYYITVKTNSKGEFESIKAMDSVYYRTDKNDYKKTNQTIKSNNSSNSNKQDLVFVNKVCRYIKNNMPIETFMQTFHVNNSELIGILELCNMYGKSIKIVLQDGIPVFKKQLDRKVYKIWKKGTDELIHTELCVVSDTHFGNIHQQLHFLNNVYEEAYKRGIDTILHVGDLVDGNYTNRPEQPRQQFLHGFDEQIGYVVDMYPKVNGITTKFILGSHDETHYKNDFATAGLWIPKCRPDMQYMGQDTATLNINGVKIVMDHPGGGSSKAVSYQLQKRIEILESGDKPKILVVGHYHKSYSFVYRNVRGIETPSFCDKTQFQHKQGLSNAIGAYFLDFYSDKFGNIQYFTAEEMLAKKEDIWDEAGKDKRKVKKLVID